MKRRFIKTAAAGALSALLLCTCLTPALAAWPDESYDEATNLIENGDFEYMFDAWEPEGGCTIDTGWDVGPCARLEGTEGTALRQTLPLYPEDSGEYELRGYFFQEGTNDLSYIRITTDVGTSEFQILTTPGDWRRSGFSIPLEFTGNTVIEIVPPEHGGYLMVDSLVLVPKAELPELPPPDPSENFISNSDFENGLDGWSSYFRDAKITKYSDGHSYDSLHCMEISGATKFDSYAEPPCSYDIPAGEYELSAWFRLTSSATAVHMGAVLGNEVCAVALPAWNDGEWHQVSWFVENEKASPVAVLLGCPEPGVTLYLDDVTLTRLHVNEKEPMPSDKNLLANPSFEDALSNWTVQGGGAILTTDVQASEGNASAMFSYFSVEGLAKYLEQSVKAVPGTYALSARVHPDASLSGVGAMLLLEARDKYGALLTSKATPAALSPAGQWQALSISFTAPAGTASLTVKIGGLYCTGAFYTDEVSLLRTA